MPPLVPRKEWVPRFAHTCAQLAPLREPSRFLDEHADWPSVDDLTTELARRQISVASGALARAVEQAPRRSGAPPLDLMYDGRIYLRGEIPTRPRTWHDLFNVMGWLAFPLAKRAINARQYEALVPWYEGARDAAGAVRKLPGARTREQDALAMIDEGGLFLLVLESAHDELMKALDTGDHEHVVRLSRARTVTPILFGHAMHEHLMSSSDPVRALPIPLIAKTAPATLREACELADVALARRLEDRSTFTSPSRLKGLLLSHELFEPTLTL